MSCPAPGCSEMMIDEEDLVCEGPCKQPLAFDKTIIIPCCGARMCNECGLKWTNGRDFCEPGKCVIKDSGKKKKVPDTVTLFHESAIPQCSQARQPCTGSVNCEGEVLRNFPSEFECDHDVCIQCIGSMLDECEKSGKSPVCPEKSCGIPYRCESVLALAAQFPERKSFFSKFTLQAKFSMQTLRDDSISNTTILVDTTGIVARPKKQ
uniref:RING-type domain-containing protein n=2 Tax=Caenorhabditis tropicalis TaxID=1561998 RepID=A0A1I7TV89_9PELO